MNAVIVACVLLERQGKFLLIQQARGRRQPGMWGPPGGKPEFEQGETIFEAAKRETFEEVGQQVELTGLVGLVRSGHREGANVFVCFAGRFTDANAAENLHLKEGEISGQRWLTVEEIESGAVPLRAKPLATIFRRLHQGLIYPLELIQHEDIEPQAVESEK